MKNHQFSIRVYVREVDSAGYPFPHSCISQDFQCAPGLDLGNERLVEICKDNVGFIIKNLIKEIKKHE